MRSRGETAGFRFARIGADQLALIGAIFLYLMLSPVMLLIFHWQYLGGGSGIQKIHPATYLICAAFLASFTIDGRFRATVFTRVIQDRPLVWFAVAVGATAGYSVIIRGASVAPFVDTFFAAIVTYVVLISVPVAPLKLLRFLIHVFFIVNIAAIMLEYVTKTSLLASYTADVVRTREVLVLLGSQGGVASLTRPAGLFGHSLNAAALLGVYAIANLVSVPARLSMKAVGRLILALAAAAAIFPTGGRAALVALVLVVAIYLLVLIVRSAFSKYVSKSGATLFVLFAAAVIVVIPLMWQLGLFDLMIERFQYDYGSSLSREMAAEMLGNASWSELWIGSSVEHIESMQQSYGLIAIEISWVNFILVSGLVFTIPLFVAYCFFLFGSLPRYCGFHSYAVAMFILIVTSSSNGIWSKSAVFLLSLTIAMVFLRRDIADGQGNAAFVRSRRQTLVPAPAPASRL
jgi:hypothetical protein